MTNSSIYMRIYLIKYLTSRHLILHSFLKVINLSLTKIWYSKEAPLKAAGSYPQGPFSILFVFACYCLIFRETFPIFYCTFRHVKKERATASVSSLSSLFYQLHDTGNKLKLTL